MCRSSHLQLSSAFVQSANQTLWGTQCVRASVAADWAALDDHFQRHAKLVARFSQAGPDAVCRMWRHQINEDGASLSQFERDALIERHCELFGIWPTQTDNRARHSDVASTQQLDTFKSTPSRKPRSTLGALPCKTLFRLLAAQTHRGAAAISGHQSWRALTPQRWD